MSWWCVGGVVAYDITKKSGAEGRKFAGWTLLGVVGGGIVGGALGASARELATKATGSGYYLISDGLWEAWMRLNVG